MQPPESDPRACPVSPPLLPSPPVAPPVIPSAPPPLPVSAPAGVLRFFRIWCALFVALYAGMFFYELAISRGAIEPSLGLIEGVLVKGDPVAQEKLFAEKRSEAVGVLVIATLAMLFYGFCLAAPRRRWMWVLGIVATATTVFPFVITAGGSVPLLIQWTKPEVKRYFQQAR
jgi:hypothetical protein